MIPGWFFLISDNNIREFAFNRGGTEVYIKGVRSTSADWIVSARVHIFGVTGYGFCGRNMGNGTWASVLLPLLQRVMNEHEAGSDERSLLLEEMRTIWRLK